MACLHSKNSYSAVGYICQLVCYTQTSLRFFLVNKKDGIQTHSLLNWLVYIPFANWEPYKVRCDKICLGFLSSQHFPFSNFPPCRWEADRGKVVLSIKEISLRQMLNKNCNLWELRNNKYWIKNTFSLFDNMLAYSDLIINSTLQFLIHIACYMSTVVWDWMSY